jgi:arabinoxylan arabinofuranohydrolase
MDQNGHFKPVKMTSCGLNGGPLLGEGTYEARIACNLNSVKGGQMCSTMMPKKMTKHLPYITQDEPDGLQGQQYIANMEDGSWAGYKFFDFKGASKLSVSVRGKGQGKIEVYLDSFQDKVGEIEVNLTPEYTSCQGEMKFADGVHALFLKYVGKGHLDLMSFTISK